LSDSIDRLPAELRDPAVALLSRMVTAAGTRNVVSEEDLIGTTGREEKIAQERLLEALRALDADTKLVQRERRPGVYFYEIASEFLVPWIKQRKVERDTEL